MHTTGASESSSRILKTLQALLGSWWTDRPRGPTGWTVDSEEGCGLLRYVLECAVQIVDGPLDRSLGVSFYLGCVSSFEFGWI
jgi:hypothetical protein